MLDGTEFYEQIINRSVMIFGQPVEVRDEKEKRRGFDAIVEHAAPGRSAVARALTDMEVRASQLLRIDINEASAKVRTGGPVEDPEDLALPIWGGHIPLALVPGEAVPDEFVPPGLRAPTFRLVDRADG